MPRKEEEGLKVREVEEETEADKAEDGKLRIRTPGKARAGVAGPHCSNNSSNNSNSSSSSSREAEEGLGDAEVEAGETGPRVVARQRRVPPDSPPRCFPPRS